MMLFERLGSFFEIVAGMITDPVSLAILFGSVLLGILFGAMPGLTSTLGVALLTALTYSMDTELAMICLLAIYVGGTYGGSYASILDKYSRDSGFSGDGSGRLSPGLQR